MFYGMPIHIIRDVALTIRSFYKRITDFVRYRQATRDMNARYPDATAEEIAREDVCIICREDMRPWLAQAATGGEQTSAEQSNHGVAVFDERLRTKKLPCGHILHFACLRSWLERQQNCPTCRRPVLMTDSVTRAQEQALADQHGRALLQVNQAQAHAPAHGDFEQPVAPPNVFNFGPLRIAFGARAGAQGAAQQVNNNAAPTQARDLPPTGHFPRVGSTFGIQRPVSGTSSRTMTSFSSASVQLQLHQIENQVIREINSLRAQQNQLYLVRALQGELARLRIAQANPDANFAGQSSLTHQSPQVAGNVMYGASPQQHSVGTGHLSLPAGMMLPPGWSLLPLQRLAHGRNVVFDEVPYVDGTSIQSQPPSSNAATASESQDGSQTTIATNIGESSSSPPEITQGQYSNNTPGADERNDTSSEATRWNSEFGFQVPDGAAKSSRVAKSEHRADIYEDGRGNNPGGMSQTKAGMHKGKGKATTVEDSTDEID